MKPAVTSLLILTSALSVPLRAHDGQAQAPGIEMRLQQIDLDVALKQYEQLKMELSRADLDLALKGSAIPEADKNTVAKKVETLARRSDQLRREIRDRSGKVGAALTATPAKTASIETRLQRIDTDVAIREYERVKMEGSRVELEQFLKATETSDAGRKELAKKGEMLARRAERLMKEIREGAEKIATAQKESQLKVSAATGPSGCPCAVLGSGEHRPEALAADVQGLIGGQVEEAPALAPVDQDVGAEFGQAQPGVAADQRHHQAWVPACPASQ
jgi:hypothetical protein